MKKIESLLFSPDHEWVSVEKNIGLIGISDYAQNTLGDVVYVELPSVGDEVKQHTIVGSIESIKAVSSIYSPINGKVVKINEAIIDKPELVNSEPFGKGWLFEIEISDIKQLDGLLNYKQYQKLVYDY